MNTAIIVAAGSGKRFKSDVPKQFLKIHDKPVIIHTLERFDHSNLIDTIVVVIASDAAEAFQSLLAEYHFEKPIKMVVGGATRAESVQNGLQAVAADTEIVAVHDGARPLVSISEIDRTVIAAKHSGAACLAGRVTDTIKQITDDGIETLDRDSLRRALTPQAFRIEILRDAFGRGELNKSVTDECFLVEKAGYPIEFIEGSTRNIKITHPDDLAVAAVFMDLEAQEPKCFE